MHSHQMHRFIPKQKQLVNGSGLLNKLIDKTPIELHLPGGFKYCGIGTKLQKRLERGDKGINPLDEACKQHDIAYSQSKVLPERHKADEILENKAWERVKSKNASLGEKTAAWFLTNVMKIKRKLGMGMSNKKLGLKKKSELTNKFKGKKGGVLKRKAPKRKQRVIPPPKKEDFCRYYLQFSVL